MYAVAVGAFDRGRKNVLPALSAGQCHHDDGSAYEPVSLTTLMDARLRFCAT